MLTFGGEKSKSSTRTFVLAASNRPPVIAKSTIGRTNLSNKLILVIAHYFFIDEMPDLRSCSRKRRQTHHLLAILFPDCFLLIFYHNNDQPACRHAQRP